MKMNSSRAKELLVPLKNGKANVMSPAWIERLIEALEYVIENESNRCWACDGKGWFGSQFCEGEECPTCEGTGKAEK